MVTQLRHSAPSLPATARTASPKPPSSGKDSKSRPGFKCLECGWTGVKWVGRCGQCQAWGTVVDDDPVAAGPRTQAVTPVRSTAVPIDQVALDLAQALPTGIGEFDRVLGGGLVPGAVILLAGEPGVGKSTLLLEVAAAFSRADGPGTPARRVLYLTGEESAAQVRLRAQRVGALSSNLLLAAETDLATMLGHIQMLAPDLVIVDSVQTAASAQVEGPAGGVTQVREVASALIAAAKSCGLPVLLVGHVTKDGSVAGPRTLEHLVDVVCAFEGDRHASLRLLRAVKNRYGASDEVGCFEMSEQGITPLADPSGLFLSNTGAPGSCVTCSVAGVRPLVLEVQALVAKTEGQAPRRTTAGVDSSRLAMILAVLAQHAKLPLGGSEVFAATVGGARANEPAVDLALALALASAKAARPLPPRTIALGEVGLAGDIRSVNALERRVSEARRLGYVRAIVPAAQVTGSKAATALAHRLSNPGLVLAPVSNVAEALAAVGLREG